jgi:hypothetical protein
LKTFGERKVRIDGVVRNIRVTSPQAHPSSVGLSRRASPPVRRLDFNQGFLKCSDSKQSIGCWPVARDLQNGESQLCFRHFVSFRKLNSSGFYSSSIIEQRTGWVAAFFITNLMASSQKKKSGQAIDCGVWVERKCEVATPKIENEAYSRG